MEFVILFGALIVGAVIWGLVQAKHTQDRKDQLVEELNQSDKFTASDALIDMDGIAGIATDDKSHLFCLINQKNSKEKFKFFSKKDILSCEIFTDGDSITSTSRTSQLGGALIGGIALGGLGAVIGGLSGKKRNKQKVKVVDLRIVVNDSSNPLHDIRLQDHEVETSSAIYEASMAQARKWHGIISVLIRQADEEDKKLEAEKPTLPDSDDALSKLERLATLRDKGILTEPEFEAQKIKLLQ